jgi:quercetin dioxygenase-like cupin family protein
MKRIIVSIVVLFAVLNAGVLYAIAASHPAAAPNPGLPKPVGPAMYPFVATSLPAGRIIGVPQHVIVPAGYTLKHMHPGPHYVYIISGSEQITDDHGTKTYSAGMFFWEPAWHVHMLHTLTRVEAFSIYFVPPAYAQKVTIPVK